MIRILVVAALLLAPAGAAAQQMYKWVDEKGTTHFSEYPPPEGKGAKVEVKPPATDKAYNPDAWRERDVESRKRRAEQRVSEDNAAKREESGRAQNCRRSRAGLDTVKNSRRVYNLNDKGERVYVDDKDRPAEIERWTREVEKYCR